MRREQRGRPTPVDPDEGPTWAISSRAIFLGALDDAMTDVIELRLTEPGAPEGIVQLRVLGGAMARVPGDATAFDWRDRPALLWRIAPDEDLGRASANEAWTAAFRAELPADGTAELRQLHGRRRRRCCP